MNLSTKQIAQVIAPYLGQDMITTTRQTQGEGKPSKYLKGKFLEVDLGMVDSFIGVLLENETEPSNHTNYNIHEAKLILKPLSEISDEDATEVGLMVCTDESKSYHNHIGMSFVKLLSVKYDEKYLGSYFPFDIIDACQYLISKGYDLPHHLLNGKTLHEAGLATYENK